MGSEILDSHPGAPGGRLPRTRPASPGPPEHPALEEVPLSGVTGGSAHPLGTVPPTRSSVGDRWGTLRPYVVTAVVSAVVTGAAVQTWAQQRASREAAATVAVSAAGGIDSSGFRSGDEDGLVVAVSVANLGPRPVVIDGPVEDPDASLRVVGSSGLQGRLPPGEERTGSVTLSWDCERGGGYVGLKDPVRLRLRTSDGQRHERAVEVDTGEVHGHVQGSCHPFSSFNLSSELVEGGRAVTVTYTPEPGAPSPGALTVAGVPGVEIVTDRRLPLALGDEPVTLTIRPVVSDCAEVAAHPEMLGQVGQLSVTDQGEWGVPEGFPLVVGAAVGRACRG